MKRRTAKHLQERVQRSRDVPQLFIDKSRQQNWPGLKMILYQEPGREEEFGRPTARSTKIRLASVVASQPAPTAALARYVCGSYSTLAQPASLRMTSICPKRPP